MRVAHIIKATRLSGAESHLIDLLDGLRDRDVDAAHVHARRTPQSDG